ncbi:MAG: hypothetical protein HKO65_09775 [Gemmatimonadetes bacterium]|nr:hypothetical protein [Gemmatimonadota bacterium]
MLRLVTFAALDLSDALGSEVRAVRLQPKRIALLAYLTVARPGGFHRRDSLLALFWPELDDSRARGALNQALHELRRELGAAVVVSRGNEEVGIDSGQLWCDAVDFEELLERGEPEKALELYRGDFLPALHVTRSHEFASWIAETDDRLKRRASAAAVEQAEHSEAKGSLGAAVRFMRRAMRISPLDEGLVRELIRLLDKAGDRAEALNTYRGFAELLEVEVGAKPSPETQNIAAEVRARTAPRPTAPNTRSVRATAAPGPEPTGADSALGPRGLLHRMRYGMGLAGIAGLVGFAMWIGPGMRTPPLDPSKVLVGGIGNRTGTAAGDGFSDGAVYGTIQSLALSGIATPIDAGSVDPTWSEARIFQTSETSAQLRRLAKRAGAGTVVWGFFDRVGDSVQIRSEIVDVESGLIVDAVEATAAAESDREQVLDSFSQRVTGAITARIDTRFAEWEMGSDGSPSFDAFLEFVRGLELYLGRAGFLQPEGAIERFDEAFRLDPGFLTPKVWAVLAHDAMGEGDRADSLASSLADADQLALTDRYILNHWFAARDGRRGEALDEIRKAMVLSPRAEYMPLAVLAALQAGRPREAVRWMTAADTVTGWASHWGLYSASLAWAYHALGIHDLELEPARRARLMAPGNQYMLSWEIAALASLAHPDLDSRLSEILDMELTPYNKGQALCSAANELVGHGHRVEGAEMLNRCIQWDLERAVGGGENIRHRLSWSLIFAGRFGEARPYLEELAADRPNNLNVIGPLAVLEAAQGNRDEAERLDGFIQAYPARDSYWEKRKLYWRAAIATRLGDPQGAVRLLSEYVGEGQSFRGFHADLFFEPLWNYPPFALLMEPTG